MVAALSAMRERPPPVSAESSFVPKKRWPRPTMDSVRPLVDARAFDLSLEVLGRTTGGVVIRLPADLVDGLGSNFNTCFFSRLEVLTRLSQGVVLTVVSIVFCGS